MTRRKRLVIVAAVLCLAVVGIVVALAAMWPSWRMDREAVERLDTVRTLAEVEELLGRPGVPATMTDQSRPCLRWDDSRFIVQIAVNDAGEISMLRWEIHPDIPLWDRVRQRFGF